MSIRPIDTQVIINSTPDAAKLQTTQNKQEENVQLQTAMIVENENKEKNNNVNKTESTYKVNKTDDNQKRERGNEEQKKKKKDQKNEDGSTFDVRI